MLPTPQEFRYLRKKAGLTQKELASLAGLSQSLIARIEKGDIDTRLGTAQRILDVIKRSEAKKSRSLDLKDYMASPVIYCKSSDPIKRVVAMMEENSISQMPVMENGKAVGSVTDTQLVQVLARKGARAARRKISDIMSKPFPSLDANAPIDRAIDLLTGNPAVLIMNGPHVAGIVTKADVLRLMAQQ
jgi:predicted transcriptional regulator